MSKTVLEFVRKYNPDSDGNAIFPFFWHKYFILISLIYWEWF